MGEVAGYSAALAVIDAPAADAPAGPMFDAVAELSELPQPLLVFASNGACRNAYDPLPRMRLSRALQGLSARRQPYILVITDGGKERGYHAFLPPADVVIAEAAGAEAAAEDSLESPYPHVDLFLTRPQIGETIPKLLAFFRQ